MGLLWSNVTSDDNLATFSVVIGERRRQERLLKCSSLSLIVTEAQDAEHRVVYTAHVSTFNISLFTSSCLGTAQEN